MTARARASGTLAATEAHHGRLPEVRQFARRLVAEQQLQIHQLRALMRDLHHQTGPRPTLVDGS